MNQQIDFQNRINKLKLDWFRTLKNSFYYSLVSHIIIIIIIQILLGLNFKETTKIRIKKIKQFAVELREIEKPEEQVVLPGLTIKDTAKIKQEKILFAGIEIDTTEILNRYEENTLDVSILFPVGWIYFDNKVKDIIDGVIFIPGDNSNYNRKLSVLIQVNTNKNLFNPALYDSSFTYNRVNYYISKPQKTFEQVTQIVYIRTGAFKADFTLKLTAPNEAEFRKFQPVFFAMVRSFSAGYAN